MDASGMILTAPAGARAGGMGDAFTAGEDYIYAPYFNPAGLSTLKQTGFAMSYRSLFEGNMFATAGTGLVLNRNSFGMNIGWFDAGTFEMVSDDGTVSDHSVRIENDILLMLSYSRTLNNEISLGVNIKYFQSTLAEQASANTFAGDAGLLWRFPDERFNFALVVQNFGGKIKYNSQESSLPLNIKTGISYVLVEGWDLWLERIPPAVESITLLMDIVKYLIEPYPDNFSEDMELNLGVEVKFSSPLFIRGGYKFKPVSNNITLGAGFKFSIGAVSLMADYGFAWGGILGNSNIVSLSAMF